MANSKTRKRSLNQSPTQLSLARVTALIGPHGSGKSELALALSLLARERLAALDEPGETQVGLADLDVIKPYFRSREISAKLTELGVRLFAPHGALSQADLPIITPEIRGAIERDDLRLVLDVGGDPVGARALGSLSDVVAAADYDLLLVLNRHRPFMESFNDVLEHVRQITAATHLSLTGIISNTHMMEATTARDVAWGLELAHQVAEALDVPLRLLAVSEHLAHEFLERPDVPPLVTIRRHMLPEFLGGVILRSTQSHDPNARGERR